MQNDNIDTIINRLNRLTLQQQQLTQQIAELQTYMRNRNKAVSAKTIDASNQLSGEQ